MKPSRLPAFLPFVLCAVVAPAACAPGFAAERAGLARSLVEPGAERERVIEELRASGPEGLRALLAGVDADAEMSGLAEGPRHASARAELLHEAVDRVAGQRDALTSRLFWHEDLDAARVRATAEGKPILSLRLLGRLDEDRSCANSRFFRTVLYPNALVAAELRERFVLHWHSVRPVPKITVDFGDGRSLETTITGNSVHYVLAPDGRCVAAIPGLQGAGVFLAEIVRARELVAELEPLPDAAREERLRAWHGGRLDELDAELAALAERLDAKERDDVLAALAREDGPDPVDEIAPAPGGFGLELALTKIAVERPMIVAMLPGASEVRGALPDATWSALAALLEDACRLDEASREAVRRKEAAASGTMEPLFERLRRSVAEDTVRNRFMGGVQLHAWFASGVAPRDPGALDALVYGEIFRSPLNDAWLGLVPPDTFFGLDGGGRRGE